MPVQLKAYTIIIILSLIVIVSYLFNLLSRKTKIPSVLLLIGTGIGINYALSAYGYTRIDVQKLVKILGAVGLIMIILEAAMDLHVDKHKYKLIGNSLLAAIFIFIISAGGISLLLSYSLGQPWHLSLLYAIPMSIISSAIVIPSTEHLPEAKKEFIIYESSFSDIVGILCFNYMLMDDLLSIRSAGIFAGNLLLCVAISALASLLLIYMLARITIQLRFFLVFALLALIYSAGELIHMPSLLIILIFGLILNNSGLLLRGKLKELAAAPQMANTLTLMRAITSETSFLLRTFFFILFGYSMELSTLADPNVIVIGSLIVLILLAGRFLYLRLILKANLFPELLLMPRGLVTILLFYSIPSVRLMSNFNTGILFFVVVVTSLLMMTGLLIFKEKDSDIL